MEQTLEKRITKVKNQLALMKLSQDKHVEDRLLERLAELNLKMHLSKISDRQR